MTTEFALIASLRSRLPLIGDDCAVVDPPRGPLLLAADALVEGVHFKAPFDMTDVGWQAVTVNVSDVAAMGGRPLHVLVTVSAPPGADLERLFDGILEATAAYHCEVAGGDLTAGPVLMVSIAVTGTTNDGGPPVLRSGARPGDAIFVTGPLGTAAAQGYKRRARARVEEGERARRAGARAMIDVSDGLTADLGHIADESNVGYVLSTVPVAEGSTYEQALHGGDDYELIVVGAGVGIPIGICTADPTQRQVDGRPATPGGWEHSW